MLLIAFADDIKDIKPPVYFPRETLPLIIAATLIVLAVLFLLIYFLKQRKKIVKAKPGSELKSASQLAQEALANLKEQDLPGAGLIKEYYIRLSDIVRHYIEDRFKLRAPEMTTEEFLSSLGKCLVLSATNKGLLKDFLNLCDIVKFAKYDPARKEIDQSFTVAVRFVEETKDAV